MDPFAIKLKLIEMMEDEIFKTITEQERQEDKYKMMKWHVEHIEEY